MLTYRGSDEAAFIPSLLYLSSRLNEDHGDVMRRRHSYLKIVLSRLNEQAALNVSSLKCQCDKAPQPLHEDVT